MLAVASYEERTATLIAATAHDLRSTLTIVAGYVDLLLGQKLGLLNQRQREMLEECQDNCERLLRLTRDFLALAAFDEARLKLRLRAASLAECLDELYRIWLPPYGAKGVALYYSAPQDLPPVCFDREKVQQLTSNLLDNALRYTPARGSVWITAQSHLWERRNRSEQQAGRERRKRVLTEPNSVLVVVADSGPGIPAEDQQEIFDEFFRVAPPGETTAGTGLGLAITRRLVHLHHGKIWVESGAGTGSRFCFLLPLSPPAEEKGPESV